MRNWLSSVIKPVHRHPAKHLHEFSQPFDPMTSDLQPKEHGIIRQLSSEAIVRNGLDLTFEDHGFGTWRAS